MSTGGRAIRGASYRSAGVIATCLVAVLGVTGHCAGQETAKRDEHAAASNSAVLLRLVSADSEESVAPRPELTPAQSSNSAARSSIEMRGWQPQTSATPASRPASELRLASSRQREANTSSETSENTDFLEALKATIAGRETTDKSPTDSINATATALEPPGEWKARSESRFEPPAIASSEAPRLAAAESSPPRQFVAPDPDQLVVRLPPTRVALQPANDRPVPPAAERSDDESLPPAPSPGDPFQDTPIQTNQNNAAGQPPAAGSQSQPPSLTNRSAGTPGKDTIAGAERLGDEPVDNRLQFLRAEAVLLEPGQWQYDVGLVYAFQHDELPIATVDGSGNVVDVVDGQIRHRELFVPLAVRYGYSSNTQLFLNAPVGWSNSELSFSGFDEFDNGGAIGDITFGSTFLLSHCDSEDVMFTVAMTAPTGGDPFDADLAFPAASLGDGFWALSGEFLCTHTYDPVVVFSSIGARTFFEREHSGVDIDPGNEYSISMGLAFAVSPKVTLSSRFAATYVEETKIKQQRIEGTIQEPMSIRLAATIAQCRRWFEPFVEFGTNDDANTTVFGVIYTY